jgi:hypothetical protein
MHLMLNGSRGLRLVAAMAMFLAVCPFFVSHPDLCSAAEPEEEKVAFRWAFGSLVKSKNASELALESVTQDGALKTGDQFKMMVEPLKKCFVYVIYNNSQGRIKLLFPYGFDQFSSDYEVSKRYYIPQGDDAWLELDNHTGVETFYLIASVERLQPLENLLTLYASSEPSDKPEMAKQILAEIHNTRKQHREVASAAERPVRIGGSIRGLEKPKGTSRPDVSAIANDISSTDFYAKTFTIQHR